MLYRKPARSKPLYSSSDKISHSIGRVSIYYNSSYCHNVLAIQALLTDRVLWHSLGSQWAHDAVLVLIMVLGVSVLVIVRRDRRDSQSGVR